MHVESSAEPGKAPKHAGQKKTYRAIAETYAFLPREAVTRFLMSCTECQKRMHFNSNGVEPKENESPSSLVSGIIDYNMPLTSTYLKQMKLRVMNSQEQVSRVFFPLFLAGWRSWLAGCLQGRSVNLVFCKALSFLQPLSPYLSA
uniref:Nucleolar protein 4 n=1 Tax=Naja naja TaxID=35670 RepID=A0A8C7E2K7_NAJNA